MLCLSVCLYPVNNMNGFFFAESKVCMSDMLVSLMHTCVVVSFIVMVIALPHVIYLYTSVMFINIIGLILASLLTYF